MIVIHVVNRPAFRPRALASVLEQAIADHPVVILTGARQTGKTTLVQHLPSTAHRVFKTLDDIDVLEMASKHLESFLDDHPDRAPLGVLLHDGEEPSVMTRRVAALPVSLFV